MTQENPRLLKVNGWELAREQPPADQELNALQQRAMCTAQAFGCEAGVEVMDAVASETDPPGSIRLKIVVVRRTSRGELLCHESNVVLTTNEHAASVGQIVRDASAKLISRLES